MPRLQFKFKEHLSQAERSKLCQLLKRQGAAAVERLFPGDSDRELASLYTADFQGDEIGGRLLSWLRANESVEFAEEDVRRKLIR